MREGNFTVWHRGFYRDIEREKAGRPPGVAKPKQQTLLVMYEAPARPVEVTPVGKYALKFKWNDGHARGMHSWE